MFLASSHTTKTSAMPSSSTLHYAAKQLDDTVINKRTQPFTQQLNISPPAKQLDGSTWLKSQATGAQDPQNPVMVKSTTHANPRHEDHLQSLPHRIPAHRRDGLRPLVNTQRARLVISSRRLEHRASATIWQTSSGAMNSNVPAKLRKFSDLRHSHQAFMRPDS